MNYYLRLSIAAAAALLAHALILAFVRVGDASRTFERVQTAEPIVLNLEPPKPEPPKPEPMRRLIDTLAPAEDLNRETDLISNADSEARDFAERGGEDQPEFDQPAEFDELTGAPSPATPVPPTPAQPEVEERDELREEQQPEEPAERATAIEAAEPAPQAEATAAPEDAPEISAETFEESDATEPADTAEPLPEPFDMAQAQAPPVTENIGATRGRESEGAEETGPTSFEANKHALGDYMLNVRRKVERTWRMSIQFKYSGTTDATALLECAIQPNGELAHVRILERGESVVYAALCKQAIERAAPFGPFPFDVPQAYRSQNLVIRWKFSYM